MTEKLTLKLDAEIIQRAKTYAKEHNSSVSRMVEDYFRYITRVIEPLPITPAIQQLSGALQGLGTVDLKAQKLERLSEKHGL